VLSLAAGTVLDVSAVGAVDVARDAGFDGCGLRPTAEELAPRRLAELRRRLDDSGLVLLDLEVIRLHPEDDAAAHDQLLDAAAFLGAAHVLAVSEHPEVAASVDAVGRLADRAHARGLRIALEFMVFTAVRSLDEALHVIAEAGAGNVGVLVDALHLQRSGGVPEDLIGIPAGRLAYVQLCDAGREGPPDLADEARHHRLLPGEGHLPLRALAAAAGPDVPLSIEVQSDALLATTSADERAVRALAQTRRTLRC
jgi:sugar phosphate isomerase/epimerase